jgi:methyltransferase (TIGR00027 family)
VSQTATKVARMLVYLGYDPAIAPLLPSGAATMTERLLLATGGMRQWMVDLYRRRGYRRVLDRISEALARGLVARVGLRKRFVDDEVRAAIELGATQVLVVGAGFDTLCMRLAAEFPRVRFFEIDHPATHASKRAGVLAIEGERPNLVLLGADLGQTRLEDVLRATEQWDPRASTVAVAEGVLMYLEREAVERFFTTVRASSGPDSRVVFTYLKYDRQGKAELGRFSSLTHAALAMLGETMHWCVESEAKLRDFLGELGFEYEPDPERFDLGVRYLQPAGLEASGEAKLVSFMAVAHVDSTRSAEAEAAARRDTHRSRG